jgi:hypothetical protein
MLPITILTQGTLTQLMSCFEYTYICGMRSRGCENNYAGTLYPIAMWNKYANGVDDLTQTTNLVEGWHYDI